MKSTDPLGVGWKIEITRISPKQNVGDVHTITEVGLNKKCDCVLHFCSGCVEFDYKKPVLCTSFGGERSFKVIAKTGTGIIREGRDDINILSMI